MVRPNATRRGRGNYTARSQYDSADGRKRAMNKYFQQQVTDKLNKRLVLQYRVPQRKALKLAQNYVSNLSDKELHNAHKNGVNLKELIENSKKKKELANKEALDQQMRQQAEQQAEQNRRTPTPKLNSSGDDRTNRAKEKMTFGGARIGGKAPTGKNVWTAIAEYNVKVAAEKTKVERLEVIKGQKKFNQILAQQVTAKRRIKQREKRQRIRSRKLVDDDYITHEKTERAKKEVLIQRAMEEKKMRDAQMVAKRQREKEWIEEEEEYGKEFIAKCLRELQEEKDRMQAEKERKALKNVEQRRELDQQLKDRIRQKEILAEEDRKLAADYVKMVNAKEEARREEYRQRKARIQAKCDAMGDVYDNVAAQEAQEAASTQSSYEKHLKARAADLQARKDRAKQRTVEQMDWLDKMIREKNEKKLQLYQEDMRMARKMQMDANAFSEEQRQEKVQYKKLQREFKNTLDEQMAYKRAQPTLDDDSDVLLLNKSLLKQVQSAGVVMGDTIETLPTNCSRAIKIRGEGKTRREKKAANKLPVM